MTLFDLLFLLVFFATLVTLITAAVFSLRGDQARAGRTVLGVAIFLAIYCAVGVGVSLSMPRRSVPLGERHCYDDWCVTVEESTQNPTTVKLKIFSDAKRVRQSAPDTRVYLEDSTGQRYPGWLLPRQPGFGTMIGPGESFETVHEFDVPSNVQIMGMIVLHGVSGPGSLIIADDNSFFHQPMLYRID